MRLLMGGASENTAQVRKELIRKLGIEIESAAEPEFVTDPGRRQERIADNSDPNPKVTNVVECSDQQLKILTALEDDLTTAGTLELVKAVKKSCHV